MEDVINDVCTVCHCNEVTYGEIMQAIKEGACDIESIMYHILLIRIST